MIDTDSELRSHIARLGEGEEEPAFHCSNCGLTSDKSDCFKPRLSDDLRCPDCGEIVEHWTPDRWVPFIFNAVGVYGVAWDRQRWDRMREMWGCINSGVSASIVFDLKCETGTVKVSKMNFDGELTSCDYFQSFGESEEHVGQQTLREFFKKNGMRL